MKIVVLGAMGSQGKAALLDLARCDDVTEVISADLGRDGLDKLSPFADVSKITPVEVDASSKKSLVKLLGEKVDAAVDLLPLPLMLNAFEAAIEAGVHLVSTNYAYTLAHLHEEAVKAGVAIMPECGLDPGIDLVIYGHAVKEFDEIHVLNSYCGGIPEKKACTNPLNYKISWNWDMVLRSSKREAVFIKDGRRIVIQAADQHDNEMIHNIEFPGLGEVEAIPNGNAVFYTDLLGVTPTIKETGRYALRWPGWCAFWHPLKKLGFLSEEPVTGLSGRVTPHEFLVKLLEPQLQYRDDEKDLVLMVNIFRGTEGGRKKSLVTTLCIERDLETGLLAMNMGVSYPASIVAQMLARGEITRKGLLSPAVDIPYKPFMAELSKRGLEIKEEVRYDS
jgi:saccharopine dehydrogenase-like NADP-dependent oxidoreductase